MSADTVLKQVNSENFKNFFVNPDGEVNWQHEHVRSCGTVRN